MGAFGSGLLTIADGGRVTSDWVSIGSFSSSSGTAIVEGEDSSWNISGTLNVGRSGAGSLTIRSGASVEASGDAWVDPSLTSSRLELADGVLRVRSLLAAASDVLGEGTIHAGGLVSDVDLTFDRDKGLQQAVMLDALPDQAVTIQLDQSRGGSLGAGFKATGSLTIRDGRSVRSDRGILGLHPGSNGTALVQGPASRWQIFGQLDVGDGGKGKLTVADGAVVVAGDDIWVDQSATGSQLELHDGRLVARGVVAALTDLLGSGSIETGGLVSDIDLIFDLTHGLQQEHTFASFDGQEIQVVHDQSRGGPLGGGFKGNGSLAISDAQLIVSNQGILGWHAGSRGTASVTGRGSAWQINGTLEVGHSGEGSLAIDRGQVTAQRASLGKNANSAGSVHIDGPLATLDVDGLLEIGDSGAGELIVRDSQVSTQSAEVGDLPGSVGSVVIDGPGAQWSVLSTYSSALLVGNSGTGDVQVKRGAQLTSGPTAIGRSSSSTGSVSINGAGSIWTVSPASYGHALRVGESGQATLAISSGARVNSETAVIGANSGGTGQVEVRGARSNWTVNELSVGQLRRWDVNDRRWRPGRRGIRRRRYPLRFWFVESCDRAGSG